MVLTLSFTFAAKKLFQGQSHDNKISKIAGNESTPDCRGNCRSKRG